jgi:hypothetical protein
MSWGRSFGEVSMARDLSSGKVEALVLKFGDEFKAELFGFKMRGDQVRSSSSFSLEILGA